MEPVELESLSLRRAWIEIARRPACRFCRGSLSLRRAWIEMMQAKDPAAYPGQSLSLRRAWIEMQFDGGVFETGLVALLTESVD